jgi:hypothetical protein
MTRKQSEKHLASARHELGLALEEIQAIRRVEEKTEHGPSLETVNAETYVQRAIDKLQRGSK